MHNKYYEFIIEEVVSSRFSVAASSKEEAMKKAIQGYKDGTFVLCPGDLEQTRLSLTETDTEHQWIEI